MASGRPSSGPCEEANLKIETLGYAGPYPRDHVSVQSGGTEKDPIPPGFQPS
jgi:hypothetical protein